VQVPADRPVEAQAHTVHCLGVPAAALLPFRRPRSGISRRLIGAWVSTDYDASAVAGCPVRQLRVADLARQENQHGLPDRLPVSVPHRPESRSVRSGPARSTWPLRGSNDVGHIRHLAEAASQRPSVDSIMRKG
jgi:hypothetical protein